MSCRLGRRGDVEGGAGGERGVADEASSTQSRQRTCTAASASGSDGRRRAARKANATTPAASAARPKAARSSGAVVGRGCTAASSRAQPATPVVSTGGGAGAARRPSRAPPRAPPLPPSPPAPAAAAARAAGRRPTPPPNLGVQAVGERSHERSVGGEGGDNLAAVVGGERTERRHRVGLSALRSERRLGAQSDVRVHVDARERRRVSDRHGHEEFCRAPRGRRCTVR